MTSRSPLHARTWRLALIHKFGLSCASLRCGSPVMEVPDDRRQYGWRRSADWLIAEPIRTPQGRTGHQAVVEISTVGCGCCVFALAHARRCTRCHLQHSCVLRQPLKSQGTTIAHESPKQRFPALCHPRSAKAVSSLPYGAQILAPSCLVPPPPPGRAPNYQNGGRGRELGGGSNSF